jgi:hypothetical protein
MAEHVDKSVGVCEPALPVSTNPRDAHHDAHVSTPYNRKNAIYPAKDLDRFGTEEDVSIC